MIRYHYLALFKNVVGSRKSRGLGVLSRPIYLIYVSLYVEIPDINLGSVPTEPPIKTDVPPSNESLARPSSPADSTTVIVPSPTKEETEDEASMCVYRIPKQVKFNVPKVSPLKKKNDFPEKVE